MPRKARNSGKTIASNVDSTNLLSSSFVRLHILNLILDDELAAGP